MRAARLKAAAVYSIALAIWAVLVWKAATEYKHPVLGAAFWVVLGVFIAAPLVNGWRRKKGWLTRREAARVARLKTAIANWSRERSREDAIREGVVEHRLGVDDFEDAKAAMDEGKYVVFDTGEIEKETARELHNEDSGDRPTG